MENFTVCYAWARWCENESKRKYLWYTNNWNWMMMMTLWNIDGKSKACLPLHIHWVVSTSSWMGWFYTCWCQSIDFICRSAGITPCRSVCAAHTNKWNVYTLYARLVWIVYSYSSQQTAHLTPNQRHFFYGYFETELRIPFLHVFQRERVSLISFLSILICICQCEYHWILDFSIKSNRNLLISWDKS